MLNNQKYRDIIFIQNIFHCIKMIQRNMIVINVIFYYLVWVKSETIKSMPLRKWQKVFRTHELS